MELLKPYIEILESELAKHNFPKSPVDLYDPLRYFLNIGGKRIRPTLTLLGAELFGGKKEDAISQALAIEMFHNFTLIHDDIMDNAPLRRNQQTVHEKWNPNIGILSGDVLLVYAYQQLAKADKNQLQTCWNYLIKLQLKFVKDNKWTWTLKNEWMFLFQNT